jgi:GTP-binding protein
MLVNHPSSILYSTKDFILKSVNIQLAIHLIDSRHKPTELDVKLNELLNFAGLPFIVLLSKSDKLKQSDYNRAVKNLNFTFPELILNKNLFFYSSTKGKGRKEMLKRFSSLFYLK